MSDFKIHDIASSIGERREVLEQIQDLYDKVPNVVAALSESPAAARAYLDVSNAVDSMSFTRTELHVIWFTINRFHGCHYCMAAHTPFAKGDGVDESVIATARQGGAYADERLETLRAFTLRMVESRGWVSPGEVEAFIGAGFTRENVFEIIVIIAQKVMLNYTNHIVDTPLDPAYQPYLWQAEETQG